ncbi:MAG: hypothetical protein KIIPBIDF_00843 [Candidatus Methanoperedenaceae archaeon GB50]|nr:MAG: hypothetical protein KIIPBIDF_00843 [Candidatus Methanoperedenaceae archaeon GB50]
MFHLLERVLYTLHNPASISILARPTLRKPREIFNPRENTNKNKKVTMNNREKKFFASF